jgi:hypothetical protein
MKPFYCLNSLLSQNPPLLTSDSFLNAVLNISSFHTNIFICPLHPNFVNLIFLASVHEKVQFQYAQ